MVKAGFNTNWPALVCGGPKVGRWQPFLLGTSYRCYGHHLLQTTYSKSIRICFVWVILKFPLKYGKWLLFPLFRFGSFHFAGEYFTQFSTDFENSCSSKILGQNSIKIQIFASIGAFLLSLMDEHKKSSKNGQNPIQIWLFFPNFRPMMWLL